MPCCADGVKLEHKVGLVAGSFVAPGFAQVVTGRRRAAIVWAGLLVAGTLMATLSIWIPIGLIVLRFAAPVSALVEMHRFRRGTPTWWGRLSVAVFVIGIASFALLKVEIQAFRIPSSSMYPTLEIGDHVFVDRLSLMWRPPERGEVIVFRYPCAADRDYIKRVIAVGGDTVEVRCNVVYVNGKAIDNRLVEAQAHYRDRDAMENEWSERSCSRYRETLGGHTYDVFHDSERPARDAQRDTLTTGDLRDFPRLDFPFPPSCRSQDAYAASPGVEPQLAGTLVVTKTDARPCELQVHYVVPAGGLFVMGDNRANANDSRYWGVVALDSVIGRVMGVWLNNVPGGERKWSRLGSIE